jgi:hypothetical protein
MRGALGRTFALAGKKKESLRTLAELHDLAAKQYVSPFERASLHFALGQVEPGFEWLTRAYQDRCYELTSIRVDRALIPYAPTPCLLPSWVRRGSRPDAVQKISLL